MKSKKKGSRVENYGALLRYSRPSRLLRFHWPAGSFSFRRRFVFDCFSQWLGAGFHLVPLLSFCFWLVRIGFLFRLLVFHLFCFFTPSTRFLFARVYLEMSKKRLTTLESGSGGFFYLSSDLTD